MDGPPPPEEDFSVIPISERLVHKNWKARVNAYEYLLKKFQTTASDTDPAFKPYIQNPDILKRIVTDSNAVAQEKGVECVAIFVKFAGETASRTRDAVVPALVDKCLGSTRTGTKNQAIELVLQYVEVQNGGAGVVVCIVGLSCPGGQLTLYFLGGYLTGIRCKTTQDSCSMCICFERNHQVSLRPFWMRGRWSTLCSSPLLLRHTLRSRMHFHVTIYSWKMIV